MMTRIGPDQRWLLSAVVLAVGSTATFGYWWSGDAARATAQVHRETGAAPHEPANVAWSSPAPAAWAPPEPQSRGREWIYEVFTPPQIDYDALSGEFTVRPPAGTAEPGQPVPEPFGVTVLAVRPETFRLRLIGYVGAEGNWRVTFHDLVTGEVFVAHEGYHHAALGLIIRQLDVRPQPVALPESMTTRQRSATAHVWDEQRGRELRLTQHEPCWTGEGIGVIALADGAVQEVKTGDRLEHAGATYEIDRIRLEPPAIEITKISAASAHPERRSFALAEMEPWSVPDDAPEHGQR